MNIDFGKFLKNFGVGLVAALIAAAQQYLATGNYVELGMYAILAGAVAALVAAGLSKLKDHIIPPAPPA